MGRREQQQARDMSEKLFNTQNQYTSEDRATRSEGRALVRPQAEKLAASTGYSPALKAQAGRVTGSEGYSPEEEAAVTAETTGVASSAFGKARDELSRRSARTKNTAGLAGTRAQMARDEAQTQASTARQNRLGFADERRRRMTQNLDINRSTEDEQQRQQEQGVNLMARLYDIDTGAFSSGRGQSGAALQNYTGLANQKGFGSKLQDMGLNVASNWLSPYRGG